MTQNIIEVNNLSKSFNIAEKPDLFLYCDGFIDTKVCCVNIYEANKNIISFGTDHLYYKYYGLFLQ